MGFFDRFFRKSSPSPDELALLMSFMHEDPDRREREELYAEIMGPIATVLHGLDGKEPHVDVYRIEPQGERDMFTYITGGMSTWVQPGLEGQDMGRIELVFYSRQHLPVFGDLLMRLSRLPSDTATPLEPYDCMPIGEFAEQMIGTSRFTALWFPPMTAKLDRPLIGRLTTQGEKVFPLLVMPLLPEEYAFQQQHGNPALMERLQASGLPVEFFPDRPAFV